MCKSNVHVEIKLIFLTQLLLLISLTSFHIVTAHAVYFAFVKDFKICLIPRAENLSKYNNIKQEFS